MSQNNEGDEDDKRDLYRKYEDVFEDSAGSSDSELVRLVSALDALASENDPPPPIVRSIRVALDKQASLQVSRGKRKRSRLAELPGLRLLTAAWIPRRLTTVPKAIIFLLASLILIGATYAVVSVIDQAFYLDESTAPIAAQKLGKEVNQSKTIDGFTVSVKRVYADRNQIVIGYTISGPPGRSFNTFMAWGDLDETPGHEVATLPILTDAYGNRLSIVGHVSGNDVGAVFGTGIVQGEHGEELGQALKYSMPGIPEASKEIELHFKVGKLTALEQVDEDKLQAITVAGPFEFEFTVPIESNNSTR